MKNISLQSHARSTGFALAMPTSHARQRAALGLLRAAAAVPLFFHGSQKLLGWFGGSGLEPFAAYLEGLGVPYALPSALLAAVSEVAGAIALGLGLGAWALMPAIFTMGVAALTSLRNGYDVLHGGAEYPLTLLVVMVAIALASPARALPSMPSWLRRSP
jgi:putative oxidoreductase